MIDQRFYEVKAMAESRVIEIKNTSDVKLNGLVPGGVLRVKADRDGVPLDKYWRNRLRDAPIDGCVEIVKAAPAPKKAKEVE